jgi:NitT/TauT family transport system ATP-binding protein
MTTAIASPAIVVRGLTHRYAGSARGHGETSPSLVLDGMTLTVGAGEFVALVGPSGCGKTTLLRAVGGLLGVDAGVVEVLGGTPAAACAARAIGLVAQEPGLLPWRTAAANVALPLQLAGSAPGSGADDVAAAVQALLSRVGMEAFAGYHPRALSGGMRQRVALARALAHAPRLLLMDEPFGALDELSRETLGLELLAIWERDPSGTVADRRVSVLFVTHSIREAVLLADRVVVMSGAPGRAVAEVSVPLPRPRARDVQDAAAYTACVAEVRAALEAGPR